jgi:hypothetical protein
VQPWPDLVPAKQHHPEEPGFEEEGGQHFIGQQRAGDAGKLGKSAPVGAKLIGHHQTGDHAHAKVDGEDFRPEVVERTPPDFRFSTTALQHRKVAGKTDGDGRKNNVEGNRKGKLDPCQMKRI